MKSRYLIIEIEEQRPIPSFLERLPRGYKKPPKWTLAEVVEWDLENQPTRLIAFLPGSLGPSEWMEKYNEIIGVVSSSLKLRTNGHRS